MLSTFSALAEPNRRRIVELLASRGQLSASDISGEFDVTPAAISQHLRVLREAELVTMHKQAQRRLYAINPKALDDVQAWCDRMKRTWQARFAQLDTVLERDLKPSADKDT